MCMRERLGGELGGLLSMVIYMVGGVLTSLLGHMGWRLLLLELSLVEL